MVEEPIFRYPRVANVSGERSGHVNVTIHPMYAVGFERSDRSSYILRYASWSTVASELDRHKR